MKKISPLGIISIELFVRGWNKSKATEEKTKIRDAFKKKKSTDTLQTLLFVLLAEFSTNRRKAFQQLLNRNATIHSILDCLAPDSPREQKKMHEQSLTEVINYFAEQFDRGNLEILSTPIAGHGLKIECESDEFEPAR